MSSKFIVTFALSLPLTLAGCFTTDGDGADGDGNEAGSGSEEPAKGGSAGRAGSGGSSPVDPRGGSGGTSADPGEAGAAGSGEAPSHGGSGGAPQSGSGGTSGSGGSGGTGGGSPPPDGMARRFFLPTPNATNTVAPKVVVDADGATHAAYPAYVGGRAFYAYCGAACSDSGDVSVVEFEIGDSVSNVSIALSPEGKPRLVLSEFNQVYYASCDENCTSAEGWSVTPVLAHENEAEITGQALALDAEGRPRFLVHTLVAFLGVGQLTPRTVLASCDTDCHDPASWQYDAIADDIWQYPEFRIDGDGRFHVAAGKIVFESGVPTDKLATHFQCSADCGEPSSWSGVALASLFEDTVVKPSLSLALDDEGGARVALLIENATTPGGRYLAYGECDGACGESDWSAVFISENPAIRGGVGLALEQGSPRVAFTLDYNIGIYQCEENCTDSDWELTEVEFANNLPADDTFLFPNCSAGAWFLDSPSIAIAPGGSVRVGYRAYDVSGATQPPMDPTKPRCTTGVDFTWSRLAALPAR